MVYEKMRSPGEYKRQDEAILNRFRLDFEIEHGRKPTPEEEAGAVVQEVDPLLEL